MLLVKSFSYTIDTLVPCHFMSNKIENIKKYINTNLINTCYMGYILIELLSIDRTSLMRTVHSNSNAVSSINIIFTASVKIYTPKTVVTDVTVVVKNGHLFGNSNHVTVSFSKLPIHKSLQAGMKIPVILGSDQMYETCDTKITSTGQLYIPDASEIYYKITEPLSADDIVILQKLILSLEDSKNILSTPNIQFFIDATYPFKTKQKYKHDTIPIVDLIKPNVQVDDYLCITNDIYKHEALVSKVSVLPNNEDVVEDTALVIITNLLHSCIHHREFLLNLSKDYNDIENHNMLWTIWSTLKK